MLFQFKLLSRVALFLNDWSWEIINFFVTCNPFVRLDRWIHKFFRPSGTGGVLRSGDRLLQRHSRFHGDRRGEHAPRGASSSISIPMGNYWLIPSFQITRKFHRTMLLPRWWNCVHTTNSRWTRKDYPNRTHGNWSFIILCITLISSFSLYICITFILYIITFIFVWLLVLFL